MMNIPEIIIPVGAYIWYEKRNEKKKVHTHIYTIVHTRTTHYGKESTKCVDFK